MSRISQNAFNRIAEQALGALYDSFPVPQSTRQVSQQLVRDNEFTLKVLLFLEKQRLCQRVRQGKTGDLSRTLLWKISLDAKKRYDAASSS